MPLRVVSVFSVFTFPIFDFLSVDCRFCIRVCFDFVCVNEARYGLKIK